MISLDGRFSALAFIRVLAALDFSNDCPAQKKSITRCRTGGPDIGEAKTVKSSYEGSLVGWDWNWILRGKKHHPFCLDGGRPPATPTPRRHLSLSLIHTSSRPPFSPHHFMMCLICRFSFYLAFTTSIRWRPPNDVSVLQFASKIPMMAVWHPPRPKMHKLYYFAATALSPPVRPPSVAPSFDSFLVGWQSESVRRLPNICTASWRFLQS